MKALIAAGGKGTRLRPLTYTTSKPLIPIANRPMLFYILDEIEKAGIKDVIININKGTTEIPDAIRKENSWNLKITYIEQEKPLGVAHVIKIAKEKLKNSPFVYYLGDNILKGGINEYLNEFVNNNCVAHILLSKVRDPERFGVALFNKKGKIIKLIEKPKKHISDFALTGIYFFTPEVYKAIEKLKPSKRGELEITDAVSWLIKHKYPVTYSKVTGWWKDTGQVRDLLEGNQLILGEIDSEIKGKVTPDCVLEGKINIGRKSVISNKTTIRGPVIIGENCKIEKSYIGPYTSIGDNVEIIDTEIENSIVMPYSKINSSARIVDSLIGFNAKITSHKQTFPLGHKIVVGDYSNVEL